MNTEDIKFWDKISTKTTLYHKNFDMVVPSDNIVSEYDGNISKLRIEEHKRPLIMGEFTFSVWNINMSKIQNTDVYDMIKKYSNEDTYFEFNKILNNTNFDYTKYKKIIFIHSLIIKPEFRKSGVTEEFVEFIYRNFYDKDNIIFALVKPIQDNKLNCVFYSNEKMIRYVTYDENGRIQHKKTSAFKFYSLDKEYEKTDSEMNEYKLFSVASKCGFTRIDDTFLFKFEPEKTIKRLFNKTKINNLVI